MPFRYAHAKIRTRVVVICGQLGITAAPDVMPKILLLLILKLIKRELGRRLSRHSDTNNFTIMKYDLIAS